MIGGLSRKCRAEEFEFWANQDVDFVMLSIAWDFFLEPSNISRVVELRNSFGMSILIHPRPDGEVLLSPADPGAHDLIFLALHKILDLINGSDLIPKLIIHPATYMIPGSSFQVFTEAEALASAIPFYQRLRGYADVSFALENTYPPGIGWEEIGYDPAHFSLIDPDGHFEFCLDAGHLNLSPLGLADFLALPNLLTCIHLHSNDGAADQHLPLKRSNFKEWSLLSTCLTEDKYMVIEVKQNLGDISKVIKNLRRGEIAAL